MVCGSAVCASGKSWVRRLMKAKDQELVKILPVVTEKAYSGLLSIAVITNHDQKLFQEERVYFIL